MATYALAADQAIAGPPQGRWTVDDWERVPPDVRRYEVIDGRLYMTTAPSFFHHWIISRVIRYLGVPAEVQELGIWTAGPLGLILSPADAVQPDFVFVCRDRLHIIHDRRIRGAPDLVVEVLSPGNPAYDLEEKLALYARGGVPEYAVIDPAVHTLAHYRLQATGSYSPLHSFSEADTIAFDCLPSLPLPIATLFADAPDSTL
jgi:Uma2 family endonuclease